MDIREALLVRLLDCDDGGQIVRDLPPEFIDSSAVDTLAIMDDDRLIEWGSRDGAKWDFCHVTGENKKPLESFILEIQEQQVQNPLQLIRVRLTAAGRMAARRIRVSAHKIDAPQDATNSPARKPSPWNDFGVSPPAEFQWSITGLKKDLARWILGDDDHRALTAPLNNGSFWGQKGRGKNWIVWFKDQKKYATANGRKLKEEPADKKSGNPGDTEKHAETT